MWRRKDDDDDAPMMRRRIIKMHDKSNTETNMEQLRETPLNEPTPAMDAHGDDRNTNQERPIQSKHTDYNINEATHSEVSSKGVKYNIPIFTNVKNIIQAKPSHDTVTHTETEKAELLDAMYKQSDGTQTITEYLSDKNSPYSVLEVVSPDVMVVKYRDTGENKVVVKGIKFSNIEDHVDLQTKLWRGNEPTRTYQEAVNSALEYDATEIIGHSRGGGTAIAVAEALGIKSTGFNSVITNENVRKAHYAPNGFKHLEFSNGSDIIVNGINDLSNPHRYGKYPENFEFKTYAGIKGGSIIDQHDVAQFTKANLQRNDRIEMPMEELMYAQNHTAELSTAQMFAKGIREGKSYREILMENEGGFGVVDTNGHFTPRNFLGNNMSEIFQAVGGEHTEEEIEAMREQGIQEPYQHTITDNEVVGFMAGAGADMVEHSIDEVFQSYKRLPPVPTSGWRTFGEGVRKGVTDSLKPSQLGEGVIAGVAGELGANAFEHTVGRLPGELGNIQHSGTSFGIASTLLTGTAEGGLVGVGAGVLGEGARYGTDNLLQKLGASEKVRGNVDSLVQGSVQGAVLGSVGGAIGSAIGGVVGGVIGEGAYLLSHSDRVKKFFHKLF